MCNLEVFKPPYKKTAFDHWAKYGSAAITIPCSSVLSLVKSCPLSSSSIS